MGARTKEVADIQWTHSDKTSLKRSFCFGWYCVSGNASSQKCHVTNSFVPAWCTGSSTNSETTVLCPLTCILPWWVTGLAISSTHFDFLPLTGGGMGGGRILPGYPSACLFPPSSPYPTYQQQKECKGFGWQRGQAGNSWRCITYWIIFSLLAQPSGLSICILQMRKLQLGDVSVSFVPKFTQLRRHRTGLCS